ncbi:MAG: hypothetical protein U0871_10275 [Gemmataceae bacterium]
MRAMLTLVAGLVLIGGGCKKNPPKPAATIPTAPAATQPTAPAPPPAGADTQYQPGAGLQNVRKAADRTQLLAMMHGLGVQIVYLDTTTYMRMPTKQELYAALKNEVTERKLVELIDNGTIILTGSTDRAGLWAYEKGADVSGGVALIAGRADRYSAEDIKKFLRDG